MAPVATVRRDRLCGQTVLESERHAIVLIDPYRKPATLEGMEPHPRHVHLSRMRRSIERGQDQLQTLRMLRLHLAGVPCLEQRRKRLVPDVLATVRIPPQRAQDRWPAH